MKRESFLGWRGKLCLCGFGGFFFDGMIGIRQAVEVLAREMGLFGEDVVAERGFFRVCRVIAWLLAWA